MLILLQPSTLYEASQRPKTVDKWFKDVLAATVLPFCQKLKHIDILCAHPCPFLPYAFYATWN